MKTFLILFILISQTAFASCNRFYNELSIRLNHELENSEKVKIDFFFQSQKTNPEEIADAFIDLLSAEKIHTGMIEDLSHKHPNSKVTMNISSKEEAYKIAEAYSRLDFKAQKISIADKEIEKAYIKTAEKLLEEKKVVNMEIDFPSMTTALSFHEAIQKSLMFKNAEVRLGINSSSRINTVKFDFFRYNHLKEMKKIIFNEGVDILKVHVTGMKRKPASKPTRDGLTSIILEQLSNKWISTEADHSLVLKVFFDTIQSKNFVENGRGFVSYIKFKHKKETDALGTVMRLLEFFDSRGELELLKDAIL